MIKKQIQKLIPEKITSISNIGGGSIASSYQVELVNDTTLFAKYYDNSNMIEAEITGLTELSKCSNIIIPKIKYHNKNLLILEFITNINPNDQTYINYAKQLASLHQITNKHFGFKVNNYIGSTRQINTFNTSWPEFFFNQRIMYQYKLLEENKIIDQEFKDKFIKLEECTHKLLSDQEVKASLLHGDLWSGNFFFSTNNQGVLIDPAVYYGDREVDLAMTQLFGRLPNSFYKAYSEINPISDNFEQKCILYNLYHIMNHWNIFGSSYKSQAIHYINLLN